MIVAQLRGANKIYKAGDSTITALDKTDLDVRTGEVLLIIGPSGSGKTTLLSLLGCVIYPTEGEVVIKDVKTSELNDKEMAWLRLNTIGFVFQSINLISPLRAQENVAFPLKLMGKSHRESTRLAQDALRMVEMYDKRRSFPRQLSGGQQQRVAIARALVTNPSLLLCDEPTASLDVKSMAKVMDELRMLANEGRAVVIVTHDHRLEQYADRVINVENGQVEKVR
ncbi:MAG: ABC transporter ATP-binding protein [Saprospirales bacterium]|nr:ABC transporter ATP-binding protein [Saprospirales bacterium]MBK8492150.1 ABC transporter ATP-binding protein [Saprospirales bacterium]